MMPVVVTCRALVLGACLATSAAHAQEAKRYAIPGSDFPISRAVEIPADATVIHLSGAVPSVVDSSAAEGSAAAYGDTQAQTVSVLEAIQGTLVELGLDMGDVYRMQVFLVAPKGQDAMDFAGFMEGYTRFYGADAQPNLPVRSVVEVAGLANPGWLVEIEVSAVRSK